MFTSNTYKSIVRFVVPLLYPTIASLVARLGYHVSLAAVLQIVIGGGVGLGVILLALEKKFPWIGVFLGWFGAPKYVPTVKKASLLATLDEQASTIEGLKAQVAALAPGSTPAPAQPVAETAQVA